MKLRLFLDTLPRGGVSEFAGRIGVTSVYLSQIAAEQDGRVPSPALCVVIERESERTVCRQDLRPSDWNLIWPELVPTNVEPAAKGIPAASEPEKAGA